MTNHDRHLNLLCWSDNLIGYHFAHKFSRQTATIGRRPKSYPINRFT